MIDPIFHFFLFARFLCFMAVIYLALHLLVCRSAKPTSKVLWFFSVITAPLTRPIRKWLLPSTSERRRLTLALIIYLLLWILLIGLERLLAET